MSLVAKDAGFAQEALAGLASTENFANVPLRKMDTSTPTIPGGQRYEPYKDVMLLQVKGEHAVCYYLILTY